MSETSSLQNIHLAARLYYIDNLPQAEIARSLNVSQAKVSRLLNEARERSDLEIIRDPRPMPFDATGNLLVAPEVN